MAQKPSNTEEEFFAAEEIEKKRKLAFKQSQELAAKQRKELKALHYMKCPKCGMDLHTLKKGAVPVDSCFNCEGVWLDAGKLEKLIGDKNHHRAPIVDAILNLFKGK